MLPDAQPGRSFCSLAGHLSRWARRVWRTFCRPGTDFIEHYECRGTKLINEKMLSLLQKVCKWAKRSIAVGIVTKPTICHGCRILIECRGASPGAASITNLSWLQEQMQKV